MAWNRTAGSLEMLAGGMALLLAAGIRNAWDGLIFLVGQAKGPTRQRARIDRKFRYSRTGGRWLT